MANFNPSKKVASDFNNGNIYKNGDGVQAETINNLVENQLYLQNSQDTIEQTQTQINQNLKLYSTTTEMNTAISFATSEVESKVTAKIPTKVSQFTNDKGYLTSFTESDPTVPSWAKQTNKPTYSYSEIKDKPTLATVATSGSYNDLSNKPTIPTSASQVGAVPTTRKVNGKALSIDISLTASDVGALPSTTTIPTISYENALKTNLLEIGKLTINGQVNSVYTARTIYNTSIYDENNRFVLGTIGNGGISYNVYAPTISYSNEYQLFGTKIGSITYGGKTTDIYSPIVQYNEDSDNVPSDVGKKTHIGTIMHGTTPNYVYVPNITTANTYGLAKVGKVSTTTITLNAYSTTSGRYYQVETVNGQLVVNVPWQEGENVDLTNYYTKTEIDAKFGDIDTILDNINGEVV